MSGVITFVTGNQRKCDEIGRLLAGIDVSRRKLGFVRSDARDLGEIARERALEAFRVVGGPCFLEVTGLVLDGFPALSGAQFKKRLLEMGEVAFCRAYGGGRGRAQVAVAFTADGDPGRVRVFEGESEGALLRDPRGTGGYGWDRAWLPDGYDRTLGEMEGNKWLVNMRYRPYLELYDVLRGRSAGGTYEAHVTIAAREDEELRRFRSTCDTLGVKCIHIELSRGAERFQPMTASYHHGALIDVRREVESIAKILAAEGFDVTRSKIEAVGANGDIPATDEQARARPDGYFEYHVKVTVSRGEEIEAVRARCEPHGAHLSRNARKTEADGTAERFVTLRAYGVGRAAADARFAALLESLRETGLPLGHRLREYTVVDSDAGVDRGWLPEPAARIGP